MSKRSVLMVIPHMVGGGAERVAAQIINKMNSKGLDTRFILTSSKAHEVVRSDLNEKTELVLLTEVLPKETMWEKLCHLPARLISSVFGKVYEKAGKLVPACLGKMTIQWQYHREIRYLRQQMLEDPELAVIVFLQPAIPIVLLAAQGLPNRIILSERSDPNRLMTKRYGRKFIEKHYVRADVAVFQTEDAKAVYPESVSAKGVVISNPVKDGLPEPYHGERNKHITTFCRISKSKNLSLLVEAFQKLHTEHPDHILRIIGDAPNAEDKEVLADLHRQIETLGLKESVVLEPFMKNVHEAVRQDAMYVSSSDYEGISNAMLESMAIGLPVVCTDCPIGGAKATIRDGENGLLVPVQDPEALYRGMKRVIEEEGLADRLSLEAAKLRETLSLDATTDRWMALLGEIE